MTNRITKFQSHEAHDYSQIHMKDDFYIFKVILHQKVEV